MCRGNSLFQCEFKMHRSAYTFIISKFRAFKTVRDIQNLKRYISHQSSIGWRVTGSVESRKKT